MLAQISHTGKKAGMSACLCWGAAGLWAGQVCVGLSWGDQAVAGSGLASSPSPSSPPQRNKQASPVGKPNESCGCMCSQATQWA